MEQPKVPACDSRDDRDGFSIRRAGARTGANPSAVVRRDE